ncbi:MAG: hypothetical protein ACXVRV_03405 [Gaiellaceae bacterium]
MDEIARIRSFRADVSEPSAGLIAAARNQLLAVTRSQRTQGSWSVWSRRTLVVALALVCLLAGAGALAASGVFGDGILSGPSAPPENDAALRALFPPYRIGHATQLAEYEGRKLFGARTGAGGYCFSATSPIDPKAEGGHCVYKAESRRLDAGEAVAFSMSGWSAGGYAPGASEVHVYGAGIDETIPVAQNGWWVGVAQIPDMEGLVRLHRLPNGKDRASVVAASIASDGQVLGQDPLMLVAIARAQDGQFVGISIAPD